MRKFLAVFLLPKPRIEHATIKQKIEAISGGDFAQAFVTAGAIGFLFNTDTTLAAAELESHLFSGDACLVVEVGEAFMHRSLNVAGAWLHAHRR